MRETCSALLLLLTSIGVSAADPCPPRARHDGVLVAWITGVRVTSQGGTTGTTTVGAFRPVALLEETSLAGTDGAAIAKGQRFWRALAPTTEPVALESVGSFLDRLGEDHCVYYGSANDATLPQWTLLTSEPLPGVFRVPTEKEKAAFRQRRPECVVQGDHPEDATPHCSRREVLAVTDIDDNGRREYWATEPYTWDTGLSVWEGIGSLAPIFRVCAGCSD